MVDPDKIRGDVGRSYSPEPEQEKQVDPEKFKRVMKVEASDESQKRQKRRFKKDEEEGEDEEGVQGKAPPPPTSGSFSQLMSGQNQLDHLFDAESAGVQKRVASQNPTEEPSPAPISTEGVELDEEEPPPPPQTEENSSPSSSSSSIYQPQPPSETPPQEEEPAGQGATEQLEPENSLPENGDEGIIFYGEPPPEESSTDETDDTDQADETTNEDSSPPPSKTPETPKKTDTSQQAPPPKKKGEKDASLLSSQVELNALKPKKKKAKKKKALIETVTEPPKEEKGETSNLIKINEGKEIPTEDISTKEGEAKTLKAGKEAPSGEALPGSASLERPKNPVTFERFTPDQIQKKKIEKPSGAASAAASAEGMPPLDQSESEMGMMGEGKKEKKEEFPFISSSALTASLPSIQPPLQSLTPPTNLPAYSKLSPEVYELFEKMVGSIAVQDHSGIVSTTVTINMPGSMFDGAQIVLDQYQTAPNSYNVQLIGNPQAVDAFTSNMNDLAAAFKQSQYSFEVNLLQPALKTKKNLIRRKRSAGGDREKK